MKSDRFTTRILAAALALAVVSVASWAQDAKTEGNPAGTANPTPTTAKLHDDSYVIGVDDVLAINVWKEPDVSKSVPVRSDGKISLPLVGEVQAAGETPVKLEHEIAGRLEKYISQPEVNVIVQQMNSQKFNVLGQVTRPGSFVIGNGTTVLDAIAMAGGFKDFAKQKSITILRQNPDGTETRIPFNYKDVIQGKNPAQNLRVQSHDTIIVP